MRSVRLTIRFVAILGVLAALIGVSAKSSGAHSTNEDTTSPRPSTVDRELTPDQYQAVVGTRTMFGLPADAATVDRLVSDSEAWQRSGGLGVPLDVDEPEVVRARAAAMPETAAIARRAESILGERFGGTWADTTGACPRVQEMIGLDEQSAIDMLEEAGWPNRTIYRDVPLDFEENRIASRVSLLVVEGEVVDARWM